MVRVLLDEDLDVRLRQSFGAGVSAETVTHRGWNGKKNGDLLGLAESSFDVLLRADTNLRFQQNLSQYHIAIVVLRPRSKVLRHLAELIPLGEELLLDIRPGQAIEVHPPDAP